MTVMGRQKNNIMGCQNFQIEKNRAIVIQIDVDTEMNQLGRSFHPHSEKLVQAQLSLNGGKNFFCFFLGVQLQFQTSSLICAALTVSDFILRRRLKRFRKFSIKQADQCKSDIMEDFPPSGQCIKWLQTQRDQHSLTVITTPFVAFSAMKHKCVKYGGQISKLILEISKSNRGKKSPLMRFVQSG